MRNAGGVCNGSFPAGINFWGVSPIPCELVANTSEIVTGLCSQETEETIVLKDCVNEIKSQRIGVARTIQQLVLGMCTSDVYQQMQFDNTSLPRVNPLNDINIIPEQNVTLTSQLNYENTKHRYSWICSLQDPQRNFHYCGATVLSKPPKPTVIVTAAHCTNICKSDKVRHQEFFIMDDLCSF